MINALLKLVSVSTVDFMIGFHAEMFKGFQLMSVLPHKVLFGKGQKVLYVADHELEVQGIDCHVENAIKVVVGH